jgi:hypothetical protein
MKIKTERMLLLDYSSTVLSGKVQYKQEQERQKPSWLPDRLQEKGSDLIMRKKRINVGCQERPFLITGKRHKPGKERQKA